MIADTVVVAIPGVFDVPATGIKLDEADALLEQAPGDQALASEVGGALVIKAVHLAGLVAFVAEVHGVGRGGLHAIRKFVGVNAGLHLGFVGMSLEMFLIELLEQVE